MLLLSIVAGCYVGFGYTTALQVGGTMNQAPSNPDKSQVNIGVQKALLGAMGFPFAFTIIVVCGSELYTSMCAYTAAAWWEGKVRAGGGCVGQGTQDTWCGLCSPCCGPGECACVVRG